MAVDGDQGGGAGVILTADHLQHLGGLGAETAILAAYRLDQDEVALAHRLGVFGQEDQAVLHPTVHRLDPRLALGFADHAEDAVGALAEFLDQLGFGLAGLQPLQTH